MGEVPGRGGADGPARATRSTARLLRSILTAGTRLLRREVALAAQEPAVAARSTGRDGGLLLLGGALGSVAALLVVGSGVAALSLAFPLWLACLILACGLGGLAAAILFTVRLRLRRRKFWPPPRVSSIVQEDLEWIPTYLGRSPRSTDSERS